MSTSSTIFIKRPTVNFTPQRPPKEKSEDFSPALSVFLWSVAAVYSAARTVFSPTVTGLTVSFPLCELLLIVAATALLYYGLVSRNILLIIPWTILAISSIYFNHYLGLMNTLTLLKHVKKLSWLPWSTLFVTVVLLIIRVTLTLRVFQLCVHLWFKKKIDEIKQDLKKY